mgnify:CR=1 FL=1
MTGLVVIGLMAGTSVDGIDAAVLQTDGRNFQALGCPSVYDYRDETRNAIWTAVANPDALETVDTQGWMVLGVRTE